MKKIYPKKWAYGLLFNLIQFKNMTALILAALLVNPVALQARDTVMETKISIDVHNEPVKNVLTKLEEITGIKFFYFSRQIDARRKVTIRVQDFPLHNVLDELFKGTGTVYEHSGNKILLKK